MTQLYIAGVEVVLPQDFSVTVKRENSFFTKNGEYTYDATLRLDNPVNRQLYGFLQRINKQTQVETERKAVLVCDGRVYMRGTEIITRWNEETVTLQLVSGDSELNYFIGQEKKIEDLDLGSVGTLPSSLESDEDNWSLYSASGYPSSLYCLPTVRTKDGLVLNFFRTIHTIGDSHTSSETYNKVLNVTPQPYLLAIVERIITALGYTIGTNQLRGTIFANMFLVNTVRTSNLAEMVSGWTVKDFLTEVERLTGVVFVTNNVGNTLSCDILSKATYYLDAAQLNLQNVVDAYEAEVQDKDTADAEWTASDVIYDLPDHAYDKLMCLPEGVLESIETVEYNNLTDLLASTADTTVIKKDVSTGRMYVLVERTRHTSSGDVTDNFYVEIDQFKKLERANSDSELELAITPAPMAWLRIAPHEVINLGDDVYMDTTYTDSSTATDDIESTGAEALINDFSKTETTAGDLYVAFCNGVTAGGMMIAYTDAYHAYSVYSLCGTGVGTLSDTLEGSLRLADLDSDYYQGGYEIDTKHAYTVECYDPNVINPRQVYVIRNRRFVCRDVEETVTATGRARKWKATFFPIVISDTAIDNGWILTHGVWEDGGAWLDDGRWNDEP